MYQIITDIKPASDEFDEGAIIQSARDGSEIIKADITEIEAALLRAFRECDNDAQFRAIARLMNDRDASRAKVKEETETLKEKLKALMAADPKQKEFVRDIAHRTNGFTTITYAQAVVISERVDKMLAVLC